MRKTITMICLAGLALAGGTRAGAQERDTVAMRGELDTVHVVRQRIQHANEANTGARVSRIDPEIISANKTRSLAELLTDHTSIYIKSLGTGALSTASFRGASASQTRVNWNGINITPPMSGTFDFSQIPVFFTDNISLYYGGSPYVVADEATGNLYSTKMVWNTSHLLGTDDYGRDVLSRLLYGGRVSLMVGFFSTAMGLVAGVICGLLAGYYKKLDNPIMRVMDLLFTFPGILLAMLIIAMLGVNTFNAMLAISIWSIPSFARMVRGKVLQIKEEDYIMATRSLGAKDSRIIFVHILKNCLPVIIVVATMRMATSIISISTLSYLGMGVVPPQPEWGGMIATGKQYLWDAPSLIFIPGIAVMVTVICFNILGDKLRDILDPSLKD